MQFLPVYAFTDPVEYLDLIISTLMWLAALIMGIYAFVHALRQRADAFTAADKQTKPVWCGITGVGALLLIVSTSSQGSGISSPVGILWLVAIIAVLVYLVDVRPRVVEIQQGPRW